LDRYTDAYLQPDAYGNAYRDSDGYAHADDDRVSLCDGFADTHLYRDENGFGYAFAHRNAYLAAGGHSGRHADFVADPDRFVDAQPLEDVDGYGFVYAYGDALGFAQLHLDSRFIRDSHTDFGGNSDFDRHFESDVRGSKGKRFRDLSESLLEGRTGDLGCGGTRVDFP